MASRLTRHDLEKITDYIEFEFFCNDLMSREGYKDIEPLGGNKDKGRDAIYISKSTGEVTIFAYSVRKDWEDKLNEDLGKISKYNHPCNNVVFVTTRTPTPTEKDNVKEEVNAKYNWNLKIYDLERIATLVDNHYQELRRLHSNIFFFSSQAIEQKISKEELNRKAYAEFLLRSYEEWQERYTPLLAEYREIDTYVILTGSSQANLQEIPVARVPEAARVSVILGESGAGKTTALWKIIVETANSLKNGKTNKIPILIGLRGWAKDHLCRDLVQDQFEVIGVSQDVVEQELQNGTCLILIDGLNELPPRESLRTDAYQEIQRFMSKYSNNRFVLCCRVTDYESRMLDPEQLGPAVRKLKLFEIRRMIREQIVDYVMRYFKDDTDSADELLAKLNVYNDDLWEDNKSIVHLARIPLYLQLFIAEYQRSNELPNNQAKLLKTLIHSTLQREKTRQAARVDDFTKEKLLSSFAYKGALEGYWLRLPEPLAREIFQSEVKRLKEQSLIQSDLTVGAVWQEILSNNFLKAVDRPWVEWLHQLICDYFLGCEIVRIWTVGTIIERGALSRKLTRRTWTQPCAIALGTLDQVNGARFLEHLVREDEELAQQAFEAQIEEDQRVLSGNLVSSIIEEDDSDTNRLERLALRLPSKIIIQALFAGYAVCNQDMESRIAEAICSMMIEHYPFVANYASTSNLGYGTKAQRYSRLRSAVKRATDILTAWTNNKNEMVRFYAAKGLWEIDKGRATDTLRALHNTSSPETVRLVKDLMDEWGVN